MDEFILNNMYRNIWILNGSLWVDYLNYHNNPRIATFIFNYWINQAENDKSGKDEIIYHFCEILRAEHNKRILAKLILIYPNLDSNTWKRLNRCFPMSELKAIWKDMGIKYDKLINIKSVEY